MNLTRKKSFLGLLKPQQKKNFIDFGLLIPNLLNSIDKIESAFLCKVKLQNNVCGCVREREREIAFVVPKKCVCCVNFFSKIQIFENMQKREFCK